MSDAQRKQVLDRLIHERQTRPSLSSAPSTESLADKRERMSANQVSFLPALGYPKLLPQVRNATLYVSCTLKGLQSNPNARDV
ncbi:hypothetical protein ABBQ32_006010 [Trebouxia sp. C0010 RCD-2024]